MGGATETSSTLRTGLVDGATETSATLRTGVDDDERLALSGEETTAGGLEWKLSV